MDRETLADNISAFIAGIGDGITNGEATTAILVSVDEYAAGMLAAATAHIRALAPMARNDASITEALSRHQPVAETATAEFGKRADDGMLAVNAAYAFLGEDEPFGPFV